MSMQVMPINTQQVVDRLTGAGVPDQQAKAHASILADALRDYGGQLEAHYCSRQDLVGALAPIHEAISHLNASVQVMEASIKALEATSARLDAKIDATASHLDEKIDAAASHLDEKIDATASHLNEKIDATAASLRREIKESSERLDLKCQAAVSNAKSEVILWIVTVGIIQSSLIAGLVLKLTG